MGGNQTLADEAERQRKKRAKQAENESIKMGNQH